MLAHIERFSIECRDTKTNVITLANHKRHSQSNEPIKRNVVAEELFSVNMNIVIVMFPFRSADLLFTCGQRTRYSRAVSGLVIHVRSADLLFMCGQRIRT